MLSLSEAIPGNAYTIKWMFGVPDVLDFFYARQIHVGSEIRVVQNTGNGLIIREGLRRIAISRNAAERIKV